MRTMWLDTMGNHSSSRAKVSDLQLTPQAALHSVMSGRLNVLLWIMQPGREDKSECGPPVESTMGFYILFHARF